MSGFDNSQFAFATTSQDVTVGVGESKVISFNGLLLSTAVVSGSLFLDECCTTKNRTFDVGIEDKLAVAGISVGLERTVGDTIFTVTDANGDYAFADLEAGTYKAIIFPADANIPGNVVYAPANPTTQLVTVTSGATGMVHWPFDIVTQRVEAGAFLGTDATGAGLPGPKISPVSGATINLYDTEANAAGGGTTGRLGTAVTGADGTVTFRYTRTADTSPANTTADNIVFARFMSVTSANKSLNGENIIEIRFNTKDSVVVSEDVFDLLNSRVILRYKAATIRGDVLGGWSAALWRNDTATAVTTIQTGTTASTGIGRFVESTGPAALPDTFYVRLSGAQTFANTLGHGWRQAPAADAGAAAGQYLMIVHDGTQPDSIMLGTEEVTFTDMHIISSVHHEMDDSTDIATFTGGDGVDNVDNVTVQLYSISSTGTKTSVGTTVGTVGSGSAVFFNVPLGDYEVRARSTVGNQVVLNDTVIPITIDGSWRDTTLAPLRGGAGASTFAYKYNNALLTGLVRAADGTNADGLTVRIQSTSDNIQPKGDGTAVDTTITIVGGAYNLPSLREGPYMVTAAEGDSASVWELIAFTGSGNTDARTASRDAETTGDVDIANFRTVRLDTEVRGVVINDRDSDFNVIDPDEALSGAIIELYMDNSGTATVSADSLVGTSTSDANGQWSFTGLREGRYIVKWQSGTPSTDQDVLRGLSKDTAIATTAATTTGAGANNTRRVGPTGIPSTLPRWDYDNTVVDGGFLPANFAFLFKNTVVKGKVQTGAAAAVAGMTVSMRRCNVSTGSTSPPVAVNGTTIRCTTYLGTTVNAVTDAAGEFSFSGLIEGVYEVTPQPGTAAGFTTSAPAQALYRTVGNGDIEDITFTVS
jgi:hypothetical protein